MAKAQGQIAEAGPMWEALGPAGTSPHSWLCARLLNPFTEGWWWRQSQFLQWQPSWGTTLEKQAQKTPNQIASATKTSRCRAAAAEGIPLLGGWSCRPIPAAPHRPADVIPLPVMKFSILCLFTQVRPTVTEPVIKIKRGGESGKSDWHISSSLSCPLPEIAVGLLTGAASRIVLNHLSHPLEPFGLAFPRGNDATQFWVHPLCRVGRRSEGCCSCSVNFCATVSEVHSRHWLRVWEEPASVPHFWAPYPLGEEEGASSIKTPVADWVLLSPVLGSSWPSCLPGHQQDFSL